MDNGASRHMKEAWELFNSLMEMNTRIHVELSDDAKCAVKEEGIVLFQIESKGLFNA